MSLSCPVPQLFTHLLIQQFSKCLVVLGIKQYLFICFIGYLWFFVHSMGEGNGTPLQYSCLANPMDGGAWWAAVHGVARSWTRLSDFTFTFHFHFSLSCIGEMTTHPSVLAWRIPGTGKSGGLPSMGSHRVGHNWSNLAAAAAAKMLRLKGKTLPKKNTHQAK